LYSAAQQRKTMSGQQRTRPADAKTEMTRFGAVEHKLDPPRFELRSGDSVHAFLSYSRAGNCVFLDHTFVSENLRGRGLASKLARAALEMARQQGWKVVPRCAHVASFIERHREFADLVAHQEGSATQGLQTHEGEYYEQ